MHEIFGLFMSWLKHDLPTQQSVLEHGIRRGFNFNHVACTRLGPLQERPDFTKELGWSIDHAHVQLKGKGKKTFEAGKKLMKRWGHFQLAWAQVDPQYTTKYTKHMAIYSLNLVYCESASSAAPRLLLPSLKPSFLAS